MTLLQSIQQTGKTIGDEVGQVWGHVSEGWRELLNRSHAALTHFSRGDDEPANMGAADLPIPRWGLLAGELEETQSDFWVRLELPGMDRGDCTITLEGNMLHLHGQKRLCRQTLDSTYHVMERAYGFFQRSVALPRNVDTAQAQASFKNGVLTVRLPKTGPDRSRLVPVR